MKVGGGVGSELESELGSGFGSGVVECLNWSAGIAGGISPQYEIVMSRRASACLVKKVWDSGKIWD